MISKTDDNTLTRCSRSGTSHSQAGSGAKAVAIKAAATVTSSEVAAR
jgi:hypothetical protein